MPATVFAQQPLTLDQAVHAALADNAALRASRADTTEAAAAALAARSAYFPRVTVTESWQRANRPVFVFGSLLSARQFGAANFAIEALNHPDATGFYQAAVAIDHIVFDGGVRRATLDGARARQDIADSVADEAAAHLVVQTVTTFGRILAAQASDRAATAGLEAAREDLARAQRRRDAGLATDADVLALVVHVADLEQRRISAEGDQAVARAELNRLMGARVDADFRLVEPVPVATEPAALSTLLADAERLRPELRRAGAAERLAQSSRHQARAALLPRVAAQAGYDYNGVRWSDRASAWAVGAELRWTLSLGGAEFSSIRAAAAAEEREHARADDIRAAVQVEVVTAVRRLETANARLAAGRAAVLQARESQRITRDRYDAGLASVNDVLRASTALLDADANSTNAFVDVLISNASLRRAIGRREP